MTSKEALEHIIKRDYNQTICTIPTQQAYNGLTQEDMIDIVKKDLEVLEILKEHFQLSEYGQWYIDMQESDFDFRSECSKEEWNNSPQKKIKEWLVNENVN